MNRKEFFKGSLALGACAGCFLMPVSAISATEVLPDDDERYKSLLQEKEFIQNWLSDLLETIDENLDEPSKVFLLAGCGKGCFNRHQFKRDIAEQGKGDVEKLIAAYKKNFEVWKEIPCMFGMVKYRRGVTVRRPNIVRQNPTIYIANVLALHIKRSSKPLLAGLLM